jgi:hypothetical protein
MKYFAVICSQFIFTFSYKISEHFVWWIFLGWIRMVSGIKLIVPVPVSSVLKVLLLSSVSLICQDPDPCFEVT